MKVSELPYRRVSLEEVRGVLEDVLARIQKAADADAILAAWEDNRRVTLEYQSNAALAYMR